MKPNNRQNNNQPYINDGFEAFANAKLKKFIKQNKGQYGKKEKKLMTEDFYEFLIDEFLPDTILYIVRNGHIKNEKIQGLKDMAYNKFVDKPFVKVLTRKVKDKEDIENIELFPIIIKDILEKADDYNKKVLEEDPNGEIYEMDDMVDLSKKILKKKLKKAEKKNLDRGIAFDVLSVIPCNEAMKRSQNYRIHQFFLVLYEHAKEKEIPFKEIMNVLIDEDYHSLFIVFALLERKEKFGNLTDQQKTFYLEVSNWVFDTMEAMDEVEIKKILDVYVKARKRDEAEGKDGNRRYVLSTLPEEDYPRIRKVIAAMISNDATLEKYL